MSYKLVIKGQSENAEFPAVDSAEIPRLALYDGTYIPLVEDDGSDGTTLKVRIDDKVYRIKSETAWEAYFDVNFTDLSSYPKQFVVIIDDSYNVVFYDPTNGKSLFTSTYLKRVGNEKQLYAAADEYAHGPWNAKYSSTQTPYAEISNGNKVGNGSNYYTQMAISTSLSAPNLPFAEVCFAWMYGPTQTYSQACIFNPNKRKNYSWQSYQTYGCCGEYINTLFDYSFSHTFNLKNTVLFAGKVRIIKLNDSGSTSIIDLNAKIPISEKLSTSHVAFAIPDKNANMPFELVFADPYLANATMQGATFDLYGPVNAPKKVGSAAKTEFEGSYSDIIADHSGQFNNVVTAKKACTIVAINRRGTNSTPQATEYVCAKDDTFNIDMASQSYRSYPWVYFAYQNIDDAPTEIAFYRLQSGSDVFGYIYNTITKQIDINTGTYFNKNGVTISKSTNFSGDLLIQPMSGVVQILDGGDSWSENNFSGFAMVFLASNSTIIVNTTAGDDVMIFDKNGTLLDDKIADSDGVVTFTVPTTKLGRSYRVQSATTGQSTDITATGNESVNLTPSAQLPDFEVMWAYQIANDAGMISGNPDTGLAYNYKPYSEFKGKMLKQLCSTTYRAPFSVIGTPDGNQYHIYRENVTVTNGEGLRVCYGYQLSVNGVGVGTTGLLFDGDVRTLITVTYQSIRDYAPFTNTATLMYDSTNNITYCDVGNAVGPIVQNPPFVKVWEGTANIWSYALSAARTYFNSKPNYAVTTQLEEDVRCGDVGGLPEYSSYAQNYLVSQTFPARTGGYNRLIFARKDVKYPGCEMAFLWYTGGPTEACIVKQNNDLVIHATTMTGDFITIANSQSITIAAFAGKIKYKLNNNQMITMDASSGLSLTMSTDLQGISAFFCYPDVPNKYAQYTAGFSASTSVRVTFKNAPKSSVTGAYGSGTSWYICTLYDDSTTPQNPILHDIDMKQGAGTWYNVRTNSSTNYEHSTTCKISGATAIQGGMDAGDVQFTADTFEALAQKVRQYFDSH